MIDFDLSVDAIVALHEADAGLQATRVQRGQEFLDTFDQEFMTRISPHVQTKRQRRLLGVREQLYQCISERHFDHAVEVTRSIALQRHLPMEALRLDGSSRDDNARTLWSARLYSAHEAAADHIDLLRERALLHEETEDPLDPLQGLPTYLADYARIVHEIEAGVERFRRPIDFDASYVTPVSAVARDALPGLNADDTRELSLHRLAWAVDVYHSEINDALAQFEARIQHFIDDNLPGRLDLIDRGMRTLQLEGYEITRVDNHVRGPLVSARRAIHDPVSA